LRVLIATVPLTGHVRPMLIVARALVARGHEVMWYGAANFDEEVFPDPYRFDVTRGNAREHLAFGIGIEDLQLGAHVRLCGPMPNEELLARLPAYAAFVLPSHNETFGMSYVEALLAGVPILYSKGTGIDGFVDDVSAAWAVDPCSEDAIAQGLLRMLSAQEEHRTALARQVPELKSRFSSRAHVEQYLQVVRHACEAPTRPLEMAQEGRIP